MHRSRLAALLLFAALALPLWAADSAPDEPAHNARLLEKWKADPEHYARLQRALREFTALPRERQEQLRQFDHDLHEGTAEQRRLLETLERYNAWLDRLPDVEEQQILAIADKTERLQAIKLKRDQQWLERLPTKDREYLQSLPEPKRAAETARLHHEDRQRRLKWQQILRLRPDLRPRPNKPKKLDDFPLEVTDFVNELLLPMLSTEEKEQLKATHEWPALAQLLLELSDKHPVLPPDNALGPITRFDKLPADFKRTLPRMRLEKLKQWDALAKHEDRWPDFALAYTDLAAKNKHILPRTLGASKPSDFPPEIEAFLKERLIPALTPVEAERLRLTENKWPDYPKMLHELAKKYQLVIPGMSLPGTPEFWESVRTASLPDVPNHLLRDFVSELKPEELHQLNVTPMDLSSRDRLRREYFRKHPGELKRLRELDISKSAGTKSS